MQHTEGVTAVIEREGDAPSPPTPLPPGARGDPWSMMDTPTAQAAPLQVLVEEERRHHDARSTASAIFDADGIASIFPTPSARSWTSRLNAAHAIHGPRQVPRGEQP